MSEESIEYITTSNNTFASTLVNLIHYHMQTFGGQCLINNISTQKSVFLTHQIHGQKI